MSRELARKVADSILYEGYLLYPYRRSAIKNRQRWSFGILYPPAYPEVHSGTERCRLHSECLLETEGDAVIEVELRFLQLVVRQVQREPVGSGEGYAQQIESWEEGVERSVKFNFASTGRPQQVSFSFTAECEEPTSRHATTSEGVIHSRPRITGRVSLSSQIVHRDVVKLIIEVENESELAANARDRNAALLQSLLSAHLILNASDGQFVSLLEAPEALSEAVGSCRNTGNFPVLVGSPNQRSMLLCSPILLYDYPQIAPESAGDFFDATEMDEMLTLRMMTMTDTEKAEVRMAEGRARELLRRTEESAREQLMRTHGTIRSFRPVREER